MPRHARLLALSLSCALALAATPPRPAAATPARFAEEINLTAAAATAAIGALQDKINTSRMTPADLELPTLRAAFHAAYQRQTGRAFDGAAEAPVQEIRRLMDAAMAEVITAFRADILKGGQDAFVPAFFRAQLFERFNGAVDGRYRAVATTRRSELINTDSAADRLIRDAEIVAFVNELLDQGSMRAETRSFGQATVGYWPMAIGEACAACHQRNGLRQQVGAFGGATVVIVGR